MKQAVIQLCSWGTGHGQRRGVPRKPESETKPQCPETLSLVHGGDMLGSSPQPLGTAMSSL